MYLNYNKLNLSLITYYIFYIFQLNLVSNLIAFLILMHLFFFKKRLNLKYLFLILLPSLYGLSLTKFGFQTKFSSSFFFYISIEPVLIASLVCLSKNILNFNQIKYKFFFIIYLILLIINLGNLIFNNELNINNPQGLTYGIRSLLYLNAIFYINNIPLKVLKEELFSIIKISFILFSSLFFSGHHYFYIISFPVLYYLYEEKKFISYLLLFICTLIFIFSVTSFTAYLILFSSLFFITSGLYKIFFKYKFLIFFALNTSILLLVYMKIFNFDFDRYFMENYDFIRINSNEYLNKIILDRLPLYYATQLDMNLFYGSLKGLDITNVSNYISFEDIWYFGAHNYFFELVNKTGLFTACFIYCLLNITVFNIINMYNFLENRFKNRIILFFKYFITSSLIYFFIWSFTGNSFAEIFGFLFFIILSSINSRFSILNSHIFKRKNLDRAID
jgi:hypothetical protein